jgi:hypothetical protein
MCQMSFEDRLAFIAKGLPIILASAEGFQGGSCQIADYPREAEVLEGFAKEEAAKILILIDAVRCPPSLVASKLSLITKRFYDHRARLIYAQVAEWWFEDVARMRVAVEPLCKTHYLEGNMGEYILPNSAIYTRESKLYADVEVYEDGLPVWNAPKGFPYRFRHVPAALSVCKAMSALGVFTLAGLRATSEIWGQEFFTENESIRDAERLTKELIGRLIVEGLPAVNASQEHVDTLYRHWPLPMYDVDLAEIPVTLDELKEEQERLYWAEVGGH